MPQGGNGNTLSCAEICRYVRIEKGIVIDALQLMNFVVLRAGIEPARP